MATTYAELQTEIADFLNRDDIASITPTFIQHAEANLNRSLRHWKMEVRADAVLDTQYLSLPNNWLDTIRVTVTSNNPPYALNLISRDEIQDLRYKNGNAVGNPVFYAHVANEIEVFPTPATSTTIEMVYREKVPNLSDAAPTNWLLDYAPDLYLYATLLETAVYLREDERLQTFAALYQSKLDALNSNSSKGVVSGTGLKLKIRSY